MRYLKTLLFVLLLSTVMFAQEKDKRTQLPRPFRAPERENVVTSVAPMQRPPTVVNSGPVTYSIIDSMGNIFGFWTPHGNPGDFDQNMNILTFTHRGDWSPGSYSTGTGEIVYNYSTDGGATWPRVGPVNLVDPVGLLGRYPSGSTFSPDGTIGNGYLFCAYPNLLDGGADWGDAGYGGDFPIKTNTVFSVRLEHDALNGIWYGLGQALPCWTSDSTMFLETVIRATNVGTSATYKGIRIFRTQGSFTEPPVDPLPLDTNHARNEAMLFGGDGIKVGSQYKIVFGGIYSIYRYKVNPDSFDVNYSIALIYSTDQGLTWTGPGGGSFPDTTHSDPETGEWLDIPGLTDKGYIFPYLNTGGFFDPEGDVVLDSLGYPHIFIGMQKEGAFEQGVDAVLAELYKVAPGYGGWKGKVIAPINVGTEWALGGTNAGQQTNFTPHAARNQKGTFFGVQYSNATNPDNNVDLLVTGRYWLANNWKAPVNMTQSPGFNNGPAHAIAKMPYVSDSVYKFFSFYPYVPGSDPTGSPIRTYIYSGIYNLNLTPLNIDYGGQTLISPSSGFTIIPDSSITQFRSSFRNNGELSQTGTPFYSKFRVLNSSQVVVYSDSVYYPTGLGLDSIITITYSGSLNNPPVGTYQMQAIVITAGDQASSNDTLFGSFNVVTPAPITQSIVYKKYSPYIERAVTTAIYGKDDSSSKTVLPFSFTFDGVEYDSIAFSNNGWVELGTIDTMNPSLGLHRDESGSAGTVNNEDVLAGTYSGSGLNKVFAAWNDDLTGIAENPGAEDSGSVGYTTIGTAPNRIFVLQWKNMGAWYEENFRGTRINFQVKLYEKSNTIEFAYGPVVAGTYGSETDSARLGASIGFKDTSGGSYHYFDVYKNSFGNTGFLERRLSPLTDWPGPDSSFYFIPGTAAVAVVELESRWNLVSTPVERGSYTVSSIYPTVVPSTTFGFTGSYVPSGTLDPGVGYWSKFPATPGQQTVLGSPMPTVSVPMLLGWNLVGSVDHEIPAPPVAGIIASQPFGYSGGYFIASTLKPGKGYWLKANTAGSFDLGPVAAPKVAPEDFTAYSNVTITDKDGRKQTLYFRQNTEKGIDLNRYDMPPLPPSGYFDARYKSGRILEAYPVDVKQDAEFAVTLTSAEYPLTVSWDIKNASGRGFGLGVVENGKTTALHTMKETGKIVIAKGGLNSLVIKVGEGKLIPKEFALGQNYPNPFNPTTRFTVEVPRTAVVEVAVYDILGRKVTTLINGEQEAGYHLVEWSGVNASGQAVSSGMYFIRMTSDQFSAIQKIMLMK